MRTDPAPHGPAKDFHLTPLEILLVLERGRLLAREVEVDSPLRRDPGVSDLPIPLVWDTRAIPEGAGGAEETGAPPRFAFVARKGVAFDSHAAVQRALAAGGLFLGHDTLAGRALEDAGLPEAWIEEVLSHPRFLPVNAPDIALRRLLKHASGVGEGNTTTVAITGTNGKTSVTQIAGRALARLSGQTVLRMGTLGIEIGEERYEGDTPTMPDYPGFLAAVRHAQVASGSRQIVMEATSHGLHQGRLGDWLVDVAVFTNLTQDHLDYHGTMEAYGAAKGLLFGDHLKHGGTVVLNAADPAWTTFASKAAHPQRHVIGYGSPTHAETFFRRVGRTFLSARYLAIAQRLSHTGGVRGVWSLSSERQTLSEVPFALGLVGDFQHDNAAAAAGALVALGYPLAQVAQALAVARLIPGRLEPVRLPSERTGQGGPSGAGAGAGATAATTATSGTKAGADQSRAQETLPTVLVDYAHTPDALEKALHTCRQILRPGGRLVCVFGCGGDRDPGKRPVMGRIAAEASDACYVTSDNPRTEDPLAIINDIVAGVPPSLKDKIRVNAERSRAIAEAIEASSNADLVLVAGKGHEDYQIMGTTKHPFSDVEEATEALRARAARK